MNKRKLIYLAGVTVVITGLIISLFCVKKGDSIKHSTDKGILVEVPDPIFMFGIPVDSFKIEKIKLKKNEMLSNILLARGINYQQIDELAKRSKPIFDVRKIKEGNTFTFFWTPDSVSSVKHMVYEENAEDFISYSFLDSLTITKGKKDVTFEHRSIAGEIESSLWNSLVNLGVSPVLSLEMMDVYQWTIDFAGIQKGDKYQIIYEVKLIDGEAIGINRVLASSFVNSGREHFAFAFEQNERIEYFDENGQSLRRAFLKAPLNYRRISSKYSNSRFHPILKKYRPHKGIDYAADAGTEVVSIGDGVVVKVAYDNASGHYIKIKHNSVYTSGYMHLQKRPKLNVGNRVKQKQEIGRVGATGYATGPHLDFRIWKNGDLVNPETVESPPVEPVSADNKARFDSLSSQYLMQLRQISLDFRASLNTPE